MGASAAGLQEPEPPLFLVLLHQVEAANREKIYGFYSAEKKWKKVCIFAEKQRCGGMEVWRNY